MNEHKPEPWEEEFDEEVFEMQIGTQCDPRHLDENKVKDFIRTLLATSIAQAKAEERARVRGVIDNTFTVYYRSIYSQDCSRNETKEDKSTEMIKLSDVIAPLSSLQDKPLPGK